MWECNSKFLYFVQFFVRSPKGVSSPNKINNNNKDESNEPLEMSST